MARTLTLTTLAAVALAVAATSTAKAGSCVTEAPLPNDVNIVAPTADVPPEYAAFSGIWGDARWDGELCGKLAVERVEKEGDTIVAHVIYSKGKSDAWNIVPGHERLVGKFVGEELRLTLRHSNGTRSWVAYKLKGEKLHGAFTTSSGYTVRIKMNRL